MQECLFTLVLVNWNNVQVWREKQGFRIRSVQIDSLWVLLGIREIGIIQKEGLAICCGVKKVAVERINGSILLFVLIH